MSQPETGQLSVQDLHSTALRLHALRSESAIIERLREEAERLTLAARSIVYLVDSRWGELYGTKPSAGSEEVRFGMGQGIAGWVVDNGEVWNCEFADEDPLYSEQIDAAPGASPETVLAAPITLTGRDCIGVLLLHDKEGSPFNEDDELFSALLCEHAAAAMLTARELGSEKNFSRSLAAAVAAAVDAKSVTTVDHSARVVELALNLGRALGLAEKELEELGYAASLHDIGRIDLHSLPGAKPGEAGSIERLRNHVFFTDAALRHIDFPESMADARLIAVSHHENMDGSGYPMGLKGDEMSLSAKILQVANAFDVISFQRRALIDGDPVKAGLVYLKKNAGKLFDENVVNIFITKRAYDIERRRFPRYEYDTAVDVTILKADGTESETIQTEALDISEGGILFRFERPLEAAELVRLLIHLPTEKIEALAKVARAIDDGGRWKIGAYFVWHGTIG